MPSAREYNESEEESDEVKRERLDALRRRQTERLGELGWRRRDPETGEVTSMAVLVPDDPDSFLAVDRQVLVTEEDAPRAREALGDNVVRAEPLEQLGLVRLHLEGVGVIAALGRLAELDPPVTATPRHLIFPAFKAKGLEGEDPEPVLPEEMAKLDPERRYLGEGVRVAVIDTGIAEEALQDEFLRNITPGPADLDRLQELESGTDAENRPFLDLEAGHGTMVAGVLRQVAPGCTVEVIKALDTEGIATEEEIALAIDEAVRRQCDIINMSFGGFTNRDLPSLALDEAIARVPGYILLVAAAGNFFSDRAVWPAATRRVVSVAALRQQGDDSDPVVPELDWYSSFGWWVDVAAPGKWSTPFVRGVEHPLREAGPDPADVFEGHAEAAGTSLAAAAVSGAIAVEVSRLRSEKGSGAQPRDGLRAVLARPGNLRLAHGTIALDVWER